MIAYWFKTYNDGTSQYFNLNMVEGEQIILSLMGVHFEMNFTEDDIINRANEIAQTLPDYELIGVVIEYGST